MTQVSSKINQPTLRFAFTMIGLAFAALIFATWYTVKIAMAGHEPVMDNHYYEKGLNYEKEIAVSRQMSAEGYRFDIDSMVNSYLQKGTNDIQIGVFKNQNPINGGKIFITKERTATSKFNEKKELTFEKDGIYKSNINFPHDGQWQITLTANIDGRNFEKTFMVNVK